MLELALKELAEVVKAATPLATAPIDNPNGDGQVMVVRQGYEVQELEGERVNARAHVFDDLRSLADWMNRHATDGEGDAAKGKKNVEILASDKQVCALLVPTDLGSDCVTCPLRFHPLFAAWDTIFEKPMTQKQFHKFIRSVPDSFTNGMGETLAGSLLKLEAISGGKIELNLDELGYHKFQGGSSTMAVNGSLPPRFQILVPVIDGVSAPDQPEELKKYVVDVFLEVDVKKDGDKMLPVFTVTAPTLPIVKHDARIDAVEWLTHLLADGFLVGLGTIATMEVRA